MLLKHLHKFLNKVDLPWVHLTWKALYQLQSDCKFNRKCGSFWWKDLVSMLEEFKGLSCCSVFEGHSCSFWKDMWNFGLPFLNWIHLFSFAKQQDIFVAHFLESSDSLSHFHLPLSPTAALEFQDLRDHLSSFLPLQDCPDEWSYIWGSSIFSPHLAYLQILGQADVPPPFVWLWKSYCMSKHKFFFWLLLKDRLNSRALLLRKRFLLDSYDCVLCAGHHLESLKHLFFECTFSQWCWRFIGISWDLSLPVVELIQQGKNSSSKFCFSELVILTCWSIWRLRNKVIFQNEAVSLVAWRREFRDVFTLVIHRVKPSLQNAFISWLRDFGLVFIVVYIPSSLSLYFFSF